MNDPQVGHNLGHYQIVSLLGEGGMGAVYKAQDRNLKRMVAIKVMHPHLTRQPNIRERFMQEAQVSASLDHPGIVKVYSFDEDRGILFIVMEYLSGPNLRQMLDNLLAIHQWLPLSEALGLVRQVALALDYVHNQGILHRDIKPSNIMIKSQPGEGISFRPVITDLGLAKILAGVPITREGDSSMGTPAYMSPEQAVGQPLDARSDVYSLGILLYELTTGRLPFPARTISEAIYNHTQMPPPAPGSICKDYPEELERVVLKALSKDPSQRFQSAGELAKSLEAITYTLPQDLASTTVLSQETTSTSLTTILGKSLQAERVESTGKEFSPPPIGITGKYIQIHTDNQPDWTVPLKPGRTTIGRDPQCEVYLNDSEVSRQHAIIEYDGQTCKLLDMNSSNGTFLAGVRLLAGVPLDWTAEKTARIGRFWLRINLTDQPEPESQPSHGMTEVAQSQAGRVGIVVEPLQIYVEPGKSADLTVNLINQGPIVDHYKISVEGLPNTWVTRMPPTVELMPGFCQTIHLVITPSRNPQSRAGPHSFTVRVDSQARPGEYNTQNATLTLGRFVQFESRLMPQEILAGEQAQVAVENKGNDTESCQITWTDYSNMLRFTPPQVNLTIPPGVTQTADFQADPYQTRWYEGKKKNPFTVNVIVPEANSQTLAGVVVSKGWPITYLLAFIVMICFGLTVSGWLGYTYLFKRGQPTPQAAAPGMPVFMAWCIYPSTQPPAQLRNCPTQINVMKGEKVTIKWDVSEAERVQLLPLGDRALSGAEEYWSQETTRFTLRAINSDKTREETIEVIVNPPPTIPAIPSDTPETIQTQAPTEPVPLKSEPQGMIIYTCQVDKQAGHDQICMINADGTGQTRLTTGVDTVENYYASWDPDGKNIVFSSDRTGRFEIYRMAICGNTLCGNSSPLTSGLGDAYAPDISPDGSMIVFDAFETDVHSNIWVMNLDGNNQHEIFSPSDTASAVDPVWSPDGSQILFASGVDPNNRQLYIMNADGSNARMITNINNIRGRSDWSPDGTTIVTYIGEKWFRNIFMLNLGGSILRQLTTGGDGIGPKDSIAPSFSTDGNWIAFTGYPEIYVDDGCEIYIMRVDGSDIRRLTQNDYCDYQPRWRP